MCGRFVASRPVEEIVEQFGVSDLPLPLEAMPGPRYNISPQDEVLAVRARRHEDETRRELTAFRWGLVPSWAKDPRIGQRSFNARAESLTEKPMFRTAVSKRRVIIPADAFYEWQSLPAPTPGAKAPKQPWCFRAADEKMLGLAGLYELWRDPDADGEEGSASLSSGFLLTCTVITTKANRLMAPVHDRMPVVLSPEDYEPWLAPWKLDALELERLLSPAAEDLLVCYRVGSEVGNSRAEGERLAEPI